jgi:uncharacterized protein (UPF0332 family)
VLQECNEKQKQEDKKMTQLEKQVFKKKSYQEALRYMDNAKEVLKKAGKEGIFYKDKKYVRMACGTAYNGILVALDAWLTLKGIEIPQEKGKRTSIDFYRQHIAKLDKKALSYVNNAYDVLHLYGYYDGILDSRVVNAGLDTAYELINKIKPN